MKSFFAAAIAATTSALSIHPDFFAGYLYGMTGSNHLDEMRSCFDSSYLVAEEFHDAIADLEKANFLKAFELFFKIKKEFPKAVETCNTMDDDKATINEWA